MYENTYILAFANADIYDMTPCILVSKY